MKIATKHPLVTARPSALVPCVVACVALPALPALSRLALRCLVLPGLLLAGLLLPCSCGGGDDERLGTDELLQKVVNGLDNIQAQLQQGGGPGRLHGIPSAEQLREVFQPLRDALGQMVEVQQMDRQQWIAVVADVRQLSQLVEAGAAKKEQAELAAMRGRLDQMDQRLREQDQRSRAAKNTLIQALDAASSRLDGLLKDLDEPGKKGTGAGKEAVEGAGTGTGKGKGMTRDADPNAAGTGEGTGGDGEGDKGTEAGTGNEADPEAEGSSNALLITFLVLSLVLLVCLVVFFPNRLGSSVPKVEFSAKPDTEVSGTTGTTGTTGTAAAFESSVGAPELDHLQETVEIDIPHAGDLETSDGPVLVQLEVPCEDPENAAERVAGFLSAEPRVLLQPGPDLHVQEDALGMCFFLVPDLSQEQRSRIEDAVRALVQETAPGNGAAGDKAGKKVKGNAGNKGNKSQRGSKDHKDHKGSKDNDNAA